MPYSIVRATDALLIAGHPSPGCPMLVRDDEVQLIPTLWLMTLWPRCEDTATTYASHVKRWWTFLGNRRRNWWEALPSDVRLYQTELQLAGLSNKSLKSMLSAIDTFYIYAEREGYTASRLIVRATPRTTVARRIEPFQRKARKYTRANFDTILIANPRKAAGLALRDEIIAECGRYMGLRRMEVAGLRASMFAGHSTAEMRAIFLDPSITKRRKPRDVIAPTSLLRKISRYIEVYRADLIEAVRDKNPTYVEPEALFLTRDGRAVSREYISATWALKAKAAALPTRFHTNRHTAISAVAKASKRAGDPTLRLAQQLAGHASEKTTELYVHTGFEDGDPFDLAVIDDAQNRLGGNHGK